LIAALKTVGVRSIGGLRLAQSALDAAIAVVFYRLARYLGVTRALALLASAIYAVWPLFASGATWPLADSLSVALIALVLTEFVWAAREPRKTAKAAICGVTIGLFALVRPDLVLLIVAGAMWLIVTDSRGAWLRVGALLAGCAIPLGVWGLHNRTTHGAWVFGTTSSGLGLWEGLGETPNPYGYVLDDSAANHVLMAKGYAWASVNADRYFRAEYLKAWRDHPRFAASTIAARVPKILFDSEHLQPLFFARARQFVDLFGMALVVLALWIRRHHAGSWLVLLLPPLYALASIGVVHYEPRYVRYVQLAYLLAAIVVANEMWRRIVTSHRTLAMVAMAIVVVASGAYAVRELHALHIAAVAGRAVP